MNTLSTIQSTLSKSSKSIPSVVATYPMQPTYLKIWYKFAGNLTNSAPNFSGSNNGTVVSGGSGSQSQTGISPALSNGNTSTAYMDIFNGGGTSSGTYSYINLGSISGLTLSQGFTICFWAYSTKSGGGDSYIFALNNSGISGGNYANGLCIAQSSANAYKNYIFNNYTGNAFTMNSNSWQHLCITINSSNIYNVYVNGTNVLSNITNPYSYPTSTSFTANSLGYYSPAGPHNSFVGNMADFRLYNTVLLPAEIAFVYGGSG